MADISKIKNIADWTDNATDALKSFNPRIFNWLDDPNGPPYRIGWVSQEGEPYIQSFVIDFPNTALKLTVPDSLTVYLHKATLELDSRVTALEGGGGGNVVEVVLPSWDMENDREINFPHGQANKYAIRNIFLRLRNDNDDMLGNLYDRDKMWWDDTDIYVKRGGDFKGNDWDDTGFSRGIAYVTLA